MAVDGVGVAQPKVFACRWLSFRLRCSLGPRGQGSVGDGAAGRSVRRRHGKSIRWEEGFVGRVCVFIGNARPQLLGSVPVCPFDGVVRVPTSKLWPCGSITNARFTGTNGAAAASVTVVSSNSDPGGCM